MTYASLCSSITAGIAAVLLAGCSGSDDSQPPTTFFITSSNPGQGGNLGGLAGADAQCEKLAGAAGVGGRNWRAYLSTQASASAAPVNARDRIGTGPWVNANDVVIARDVAELHGTNNLNKETALTETGAVVPARPDPENKHDILTGSQPDGTAFAAGTDRTCGNWTSGDAGAAFVGHHNRTGTNPDPVANVSWNSSHATPGCSNAALERVGGAGLLYCFAAR